MMEYNTSKHSNDNPGKEPPDSVHRYRTFVGRVEGWDITSARQFNLLTALGLREEHYLLDIGCGSLRTGRLLIPYLLPGRYFGIEPERWLIEEGIKNECGEDLIKIKAPVFSNDNNFTCTQFGQKFDFILAYSIFTHASQAQIRRCLSQVKECLKPNSIFVATFIKGNNNYAGEEWVYPDFVTYTLELMTQIVNEFGLKCHFMDWYHRNQTMILITDPETKVSIPDSNLIPMLKLELNDCKKRLQDLESHPYIRIGMKINRGIRRIKKLLRY
jgi:SAM-dependent methyltransferase